MDFTLPSFEDLIRTNHQQKTIPVKTRQLSTIAPVARENKLKVAGYTRISTDHEEQLTSSRIQKEHLLTLASQHPEWEFVGVYCDIISGTKAENRPDLQRLLTDCRDGKINLVLTKSISRFARSTTDLLEMVRNLTACGVNIVFDKEHIDTRTMSSEFLMTLLVSLAEDESYSISANCRWGLQRRFQNGTYKMSTAPYGYELKDGNLVINEQEAAVVREIFNRYISGEGYTKIARALNERGITTKRVGEERKDGHIVEGKWDAGTIGRLLKNEAYMGDMLMQKTYKDRNFHTRRNDGVYPQYYAEDHHPAIVTPESFQKAQEIMKNRPKLTGERRTYPLSGMLVCGKCGSKLIRYVQRTTGRVSWVCGKHRRNSKECGLQPVFETLVQTAFMDVLRESVEQVAGFQREQIKEWKELHGKKLERLERRKDEVEERLHTMEASGTVSVDQLQERNRLIQEKTDIQKQQDRMQDKRIRKIAELLGLMKSLDSSSLFTPEMFQMHVEKVIVTESKFDFHFKCGLVLRWEQNDSREAA